MTNERMEKRQQLMQLWQHYRVTNWADPTGYWTENAKKRLLNGNY